MTKEREYRESEEREGREERCRQRGKEALRSERHVFSVRQAQSHGREDEEEQLGKASRSCASRQASSPGS